MSTVCISKIPKSSSKLYYWNVYTLSRSYIYNYDIYEQVVYHIGGIWRFTNFAIPELNPGWSFIETIDMPLTEYIKSEYRQYKQVYTSDGQQDGTADRSQLPNEATYEETIQVNPVDYLKGIFTGESGQTSDDLWGLSKDYYLNDEQNSFWRLTKTEETIENSNILVGIVASEDPDAYPVNAQKGDYWYIKRR